MATSKFTFYNSNDIGAPSLTGQSGSLINILQACLVTGYGSKPAAGWSNPIPNGGGYGSFMPASGSMMTMMINDSAPTSSAALGGPREAMMVGWENLVSYTASVNSSPIFNVGSGSGQFPTIANIQAQSSNIATGIVPSGSLMIRKSSTADTVPRTWIMFADAYTMYLFIYCSDTATFKYGSYWFGDFFSLKGSSDAYRCMLHGRWGVNTGDVTGKMNWGDLMWSQTVISNAILCPRTFSGVGQSLRLGKIGDMGKCNTGLFSNVVTTGATNGAIMNGFIPAINSADNSLYMSPLWLQEETINTLRGRFRGLWQVCHPVGSFSDGQIIYGANELAGKTFQIVSPGEFGGFWAVEISATVETN